MKWTEEQVRFEAETPDVTLAGTLTMPAQPWACALLFSGSGPQDRDESIAGHRPFQELAESLASAGIAALRWDDRGVGDSGGDYSTANADDLVNDGARALAWARYRLPRCRQALVGHSQGTLVATRLAGRQVDQVDGLVLLAGAGRPGREVLLDQHARIAEAEGIDTESIEATLEFKRVIFDLLEAAEEQIAAGEARADIEEQLQHDLLTLMTGGTDLSALSEAERREVEETLEELLDWEWRFLLSTSPSEDLAQVRVPVLALMGERDLHVAADVDLPEAVRALQESGNARVVGHALPELNHLFQRCETGALSEYPQLGRWAPEALELITKWFQTELGPR